MIKPSFHFLSPPHQLYLQNLETAISNTLSHVNHNQQIFFWTFNERATLNDV
jgi:hypothetical protein